MKMIAIGDFLTETQAKQALDIYNTTPDGLDRITRIVHEVLEPIMPEINRKLGQENDAHYLGYAIVWAFDQAVQKGTT
jgi:hypothetical protein